MNNFLKLFIVITTLFSLSTFAQNTQVIDDTFINANEERTLTADTEWILEGYVFVEEGAVLNIEPGTVIKAKPGDVEDPQGPSALIVARGGQIFARGTADKPIIFTAEADDVNDPDDIPLDRSGLWGGVIILGNATINIPGGTEQIEGISVNEPRGNYGGTDDDDNSGVFRYVSIRHGGVNIGQNNEINGLTLGGVGRGTVIEYVEVFSNFDDGFEFFGGTVNTKYLVASYCQDDAFDYDNGFRGLGQFWFAIQDDESGNYGGEHDGGDANDDDTPYAIPQILNATYIGSGNKANTAEENPDSKAFLIRDGAGGKYRNSIFAEFPSGGVEIEDKGTGSSRDRLEQGDLVLSNNIWWNVGGTNNSLLEVAPDATEQQQFTRDYLGANNNFLENPMFNGIERLPESTSEIQGNLDPRVEVGGPAYTNPIFAYDEDNDPDEFAFFSEAPYYGAFGSGALWIKGWTFIDQIGLVSDGDAEPGVVEVFDTDINPDDNVTWTKDNVYHLNGFVFVEEGATLNIEAGTVIKGRQGQGADASALIIAKGGKIFATGTSDEPIIFTSILDDVNDPNDIPLDRSGLWGGLIILGNSTINNPGGTEQIEGIPSNEPRGQYGGTDEDDNSGIVRYVSIRHGGTSIGQNNEINGLSMGAVGRGTVIEYVEVWSNNDDGFEFFGGTVNTKYLVAAYCKDDAFDYDEGFRGLGQFWFAIQDEGTGNYGGEHDGGSVNDDDEPFAIPQVLNATYIGSGNVSPNADSEVFLIRDNAGGKYRNSIFADFNGGVEIEDKGVGSSKERLDQGDLILANNLWWNISDNELSSIAPQQFVQDHLAANNNFIADPGFAGIERLPNTVAEIQGNLDPRVAGDGPAFTNPIFEYDEDNDPEEYEFFSEAPYYGAFGSGALWIKGWTFMDQVGLVSDGNAEPGVVEVFDTDINPDDNVTWTKDNVYHLNGFVFVEEGATLNIEAGTVIKGREGQGADASALIIARGAKIFATGTSDEPIIFTSILDDVNDPNDIPLDRSGLWGSVIILGNSTINNPGGTEQIEGIPSNEPRGQYGGDDEDDNSGIFRYVSIRHGGTSIGQNNEINGLSMGAVGRGTVIEYVEVWSNNDDGFEFFGGTVNTKYLVAAYCKDDAFDYDEGFRGLGQFWFAIQDEGTGNYGGEHDGGSVNDDDEPFAIPQVLNATYIGSGNGSPNADSEVFLIRDNAGGKYRNSVFASFNGGVEIEDKGVGSSKERLDQGDLILSNNLWWDIADNELGSIAPQQFVQDHLAANNNFIADPGFAGIERLPNTVAEIQGNLDPRVAGDGPAFTNPIFEYDEDNDPEEYEFFSEAPYYGAFGSGALWIKGWTFMDQVGLVSDGNAPTGVVEVFDTDINPDDNVTWTKDNVYHLNGFVFVEEGATLNIQEGTVIKGRQGQGADASALIIARGATINATGTKDNPIIFTSILDDVNDPDDLTVNRRGLWGSLIILGNARINNPGGVEQIEGIPSNEPRGQYGGNDDNDNSGVVRYVSIRHGGTSIGQNNEINGLSMGAVGSETTLEYIEIFANFDDGFEFFGGTAELKNAVVAFCGDDSFDYDEGWRGKGQFWFSIQAEDAGNYGGEHDGGSVNDDDEPFAIPTIYNVTYVGSGQNSNNPDSEVFLIRDNAGGYYRNSIFMESVGGIEIEDKGVGSSKERLDVGDLAFNNNIWWNVADNSLAGVAPQQFVQDHLGANGNIISNPNLGTISRTNDGTLDPTPLGTGGDVYNAQMATYPNGDDFFTNVDYMGAFPYNSNWMEDWTALDDLGFLADEPTSVSLDQTTSEDVIAAYPNPAETTTRIEFNVADNSNISLIVTNVMGDTVAELENSFHTAGAYSTNWNVDNVTPGVYFVTLKSTQGNFTTKVIVK